MYIYTFWSKNANNYKIGKWMDIHITYFRVLRAASFLFEI